MSFGGCTYFIQIGDDGPIKIGKTKSLPRRLRSIEMAVPYELRVRATLPGLAVERELHRQFRAGRIRGEWFHPTDDLLEFIQSIRGGKLDRDLETPPIESPPPVVLEHQIEDPGRTITLHRVAKRIGLHERCRTNWNALLKAVCRRSGIEVRPNARGTPCCYEGEIPRIAAMVHDHFTRPRYSWASAMEKEAEAAILGGTAQCH